MILLNITIEKVKRNGPEGVYKQVRVLLDFNEDVFNSGTPFKLFVTIPILGLREKAFYCEIRGV